MAKHRKHGKGNESSGQPQGTNGGGSVEQVQEQAGQALGSVQQKAGQIVEPIKKLAFSQLDNQKEHIVNRLFSATVTIRQLDDQLREQDQQTIAQYGDTAVRQLERFTSYLRDHETSTLVQEAGNFVKRNPVIFVGGALALGLLGARFLKSSGGQAAAGGASGSQGTNGSQAGATAGAPGAGASPARTHTSG